MIFKSIRVLITAVLAADAVFPADARIEWFGGSFVDTGEGRCDMNLLRPYQLAAMLVNVGQH